MAQGEVTPAEPEFATVDQLTEFGPVLTEQRVVFLKTGAKVKVRGLTRFEMMLTRKNTEDPAVIEQRTLAFCMVKPKMTTDEAEAWQRRTDPMVIAPVTEAIRDLSGLGEGADKSDLRDVRE